MLDPGDEILLRRSAQGDERAFVQLVRRYRQALVRYVRSRIGHPDDAEDVLQETLLAAWVGLHQLRDPTSVRAWLLQVAHHRCQDYFRAKGRRDVPTEERHLEQYANRFGLRQYRQARTLTEAMEALEAMPMAERETARRFYLEGLTIAEIAAQTQCPPGTVKRRLFQARNLLRQTLGVALQERSADMGKQARAARTPAFPAQRPQITITPSEEAPFPVDCPELRWWSIIPRVGERASWAEYEPPHWNLMEVTEMQVVRPAKVHDVEGVEIEIRPWKAEAGWQPPWTMVGRLTEQKAQYLATIRQHEGTTLVFTFLDADFDWDWGEMDRVLEDRGRFLQEADGSLRLVGSAANGETGGAGVFSVAVDDKQFTCLRVLEVGSPVQEKTARLIESYLTREGRTVLTRHYCHPDFAQVARFPVVVDPTERRVVEGAPFAHWYDTLTDQIL
ncbi:MAG TPA: RNA polymerase sigma factor [Chthonomonadaceae bacterium]|nr:RNA polymerase sigma factor [Chthonomonadaceae bacterium]